MSFFYNSQIFDGNILKHFPYPFKFSLLLQTGKGYPLWWLLKIIDYLQYPYTTLLWLKMFHSSQPQIMRLKSPLSLIHFATQWYWIRKKQFSKKSLQFTHVPCKCGDEKRIKSPAALRHFKSWYFIVWV